MNIGRRIKNLREEHGLTQLAFAKILNVNNSTLSQYESGDRVPSDATKVKIANYFQVTLDYLMGRTDEKVQSPTEPDEKLDRNIIFISGRDGSRYEYEVSDGQKELVKQVLDNLRPTEEERL